MTMRPRDRMALIAFLVAIAACAFYILVLTPEHHKAKALDAKIATQQQALATTQQQVASGRAALAKLRTAQAQLASVNLAVPAHSDMPEVLRALERAAKAAHVQMQSITVSGSTGGTPQSSVSGSASGSAPSPSGTGTAPTATPIQLTFAGGYLALEKLVRRLDGFVVVSGNRVNATGPLLIVSSVQLSGAPKLTANLSADIYQRSAAPAPSAATATPTAPTSTQAPTAVASAAPRTAG